MQRPKPAIEFSFQKALDCHKSGQLLQAKKICENILALSPDSPDTLNLLGLIAYQQRDFDTAIALVSRAVGIAPDRPAYYYILGNAYKDKGLQPQSTACFRRVLKLDPGSAEAYFKIGVIEYESGNIDRALACFRSVLELKPDFPAVHTLVGDMMQKAGRPDSALANYLAALEYDHQSAELYNKIGTSYKQQRKYRLAQANFHRALELIPDMPDALFNLALIHADSGECDAAIGYYQRVLEIEPDSAETLYNLAGLFANKGQFDHAIRLFQKALIIKPDHADTHNNLGLSLKALGKIEEAILQFKKAIDIDPAPAHVHLNLALALLLAGEFSEGWREYDWRFEVEAYKSDYRYRDRKIWDGKSFKGKCLLVHDDQGLGDTLQFVRYLPLVKKMGGTVILETRREIIPLLTEFPGIDLLLQRPPKDPSNVRFDYYIPLLSIPGRMGTQHDSIPANIPYLYGETEKNDFWKEKMKKPGLKIGLVWAGNKTHINDRNRSCSLDLFNWLQDISNISLFSLQKTVSPAEESQLKKLGAENFGPRFNNFSDTAAVIENLDLIITVDTAVAHLAGAMGKTTWILLPFDPDWRWMVARPDSPWYPTVRLFRQSRSGDWDGVMSAVCRALKDRLQSFDEGNE
jgi:tetratricopeptide (TPR) repeat protein